MTSAGLSGGENSSEFEPERNKIVSGEPLSVKKTPENEGETANIAPRGRFRKTWRRLLDERERVSRCVFRRAEVAPSGCIEIPTSERDGVPCYPRVWIGNKQFAASRLIYAIFNGALPEDVQICHTCDNPRCINPCHLVASDGQGNAMDMVAKTRGAHQKLCNEDTLALRHMREDGSPMWELAALFGVCAVTVSAICAGKTHKHQIVEEEAR